MQTKTVSLSKQLLTMTWPMVFGVLSLMSFQLVDSAFIGQLGVIPLAAQGFTMPMQMIVIGLQVGLGIATTAVISRALGNHERHQAQNLGGLVVGLGSLSIAILLAIIYGARHPILALLSAPQAVYPIIDVYWIVWLISAWSGALLYFLYSLCRANGNTMLPGSMMVVTSVTNIILDPIFIFKLHLGIEGAAVATICSFVMGILIVLPKVYQRRWMTFDWQDFPVLDNIRNITHIMGPAMISQLLPPLSSMLATKLLATFGTAAVAAWAVGSRFEFFSIVTVLALTMSMPPMIGRRLGEKKFAEIQTLIHVAIVFILVFQTLLAVITFFGAPQFAALMASDREVQSILNWHLMTVPISLGFLGICILIVSVSNALGKSYTALCISGMRLFLFFLPCLWLGSLIDGLHGIYLGALIGNIFAGTSAWLMYRRTIKQLARQSA